jgi:hypothetical protein
MSYWRTFLSLLIAAILAASNIARAEGAQWEQFDKWWPMCVFDGSGGGNVNAAVTEMVKMAAKCKVNLDVRPFSIPPGTGAGNVKKLSDDARAKCNLTYGFQKMGVNRASILVIGDARSAQAMCNAMGAKDRQFCGELSFDRGKAQEFRMRGTGYFGGTAPAGQPAFSVVGGSAINARDMSAVALGQGMMGLPQGFGAGNGVGAEFEGQAAGGSNVDSGWSDYGCKKMRAAAFDNRYRGMKYKSDFTEWYPTTGKLRYVDIADKSTPLFGGAVGNGGGGGGAGPAALPSVSPANSGAGKPASGAASEAESVFRKTTPPSAKTAEGAASGHPNRTNNQVTSLRGSDDSGVEPVNVPTSDPGQVAAKGGNKTAWDEGAKVSDDLAKELGISASQLPQGNPATTANTPAVPTQNSVEAITAQTQAQLAAITGGATTPSAAATAAAEAAVSAAIPSSIKSANATGEASPIGGTNTVTNGSAPQSFFGASSSMPPATSTGEVKPKQELSKSGTLNADFFAKKSKEDGGQARPRTEERNGGSREEEGRGGRRPASASAYGGSSSNADGNVTRIGR